MQAAHDAGKEDGAQAQGSDAAQPPSTAQGPSPAEEAKAAAFFARLGALRIAHETLRHPPLFTVEQSQALRGTIPGGHVKNLFVKDKKSRFFLVTAREDARIDLKRLHEAIGGSGRVSFGSAEQLRDLLGVEPGSVTPVAVMNDTARVVTLLLDRNLLRETRINVHPLVNTMTTGLARDDLLAFVQACGHEPLVIDLPAPPEA